MLGVLTWCIAAGVACSDDDDDDKSGDTASGVVASGSGGAGGSAGRAGNSAGTAGRAGPPPVQCGTSQCRQTLPVLDGFTLQLPCCADEATNLCGWTPPGGNGECVAPPPVVAACPALGNGQQGCCIEELDRCGIDGSQYAEACYNIAESMFAEGNPDLVPRTCDGEPVAGTDGDGGVEDSDGGVEDDDAGASDSDAGAVGLDGGSAGVGGGGGAGGRGGRGGFPGRFQ
jgi:hypothetical protein